MPAPAVGPLQDLPPRGRSWRFLRRGCAVLLLLGNATASEAAAIPVPVDIDFAAPQRPLNMAGILEGWSADRPADTLLTPLMDARDRQWARIFFNRPAAIARGRALGYQVMIRLDRYETQGAHRWPWQDWSAWEDFVRAQAQRYGADGVAYDVWNEPDWQDFWPGTREQFFEAYVRASRVIAAEQPAARISGPSIHRWDPAWIRAFLDHCLAQHARVDLLQWHELDARDGNLPQLAETLRSARQEFLQSPAYAALGLRGIIIGESVGARRAYLPASRLAYLAHLEAGGADGACNACWHDDCERQSLSGLLDRSGQPRAVWWVCAAYADGVGGRVSAHSPQPGLAVLATARRRDAPLSAQILLGTVRLHGRPAVSAATLTLRSLTALGYRDGDELRLAVSRIEDAGAATSSGPALLPDLHGRVAGDAAQIRLAGLPLESVTILNLPQHRTPDASPATAPAAPEP